MIEMPKTHTEGLAFISKYSLDRKVTPDCSIYDCIREIEPKLDRFMEFGNTFANPKFRSKYTIFKWIARNVKYPLKSTTTVLEYFVDKYDGMVVFKKNAFTVTTLTLK